MRKVRLEPTIGRREPPNDIAQSGHEAKNHLEEPPKGSAMSISKITNGVSIGVLIALVAAWGGSALLNFAQKQIAIYQCVSGIGHDSVRVYEIEACMTLHGWHAVVTNDGIDWVKGRPLY